MADEFVIVSTTASDEGSAQALASSIVKAQLGACVQMIAIKSTYVWQDELRTEPEARLEIKTAARLIEPLMAHIAANHSYDLPEVVVTPIIGGSKAYLDWVNDRIR